MSAQNIFEAFAITCRNYPDSPALYFKQQDAFTYFTYQNLYSKVLAFSGFLTEQGLKPHDTAAIILENSFYWPIAFMGVMSRGATALPLNPQLELANLHYFLSHSQAEFVITTSELYARYEQYLIKEQVKFILIDAQDAQFVIPPQVPQELMISSVTQDDTAVFMYTSGTTRLPKGVILTHKNLLSNVAAIQKLGFTTQQDCFISILPLFHAYPLMTNLILPLLSGAKISYPSSLDLGEIARCMVETKVTIMTAVPRLLSLLEQKIKASLNKTFFKKTVLAIVLKSAVFLRKYFKKNLAKFLLKELHVKFGASLRFIISGGAKLDKTLANNLYTWGFEVLEGYGLTETSPVVTFNTPWQYKLGSAGKAAPEVEIKINHSDQDGIGEILIRGENVSPGYYKDHDSTNEAFKNGWFYSGDLGYKDKEGFLFITGRKKEILVLASGKNINPEEIESHYALSPYIKEICVFLSKSDLDETGEALTALILPDYEQFSQNQIKQVKDRLRLEIESLSRRLPAYKRIKKYILSSEPVPKTVLGKIKRYQVQEQYAQTKGEEKKIQSPGDDDTELLKEPIAQKITEYLSQKFKKPIYGPEHLELDLGLDSLGQLELLIEIQKIASTKLDDKELLEVFTVKDILEKFKIASSINLKQAEIFSWQKELLSPASPEFSKTVAISQSLLAKSINGFFYFSLKCLLYPFWRLRTKGKINLPKSGPYILCPNHSSYLDGPLLALSLPLSLLLNTYLVGFAAIFKFPLIAWANKSARLVPIDSSLDLLESLKVCACILRNAKILCVFPGGGRSLDGSVGEFKRGVGILVKELNVPVIPVYIEGTYKAWPAFRRLPRPAKVTITFGKRLTLTDLAVSAEGDDVYRTIVEKLREKIIALKSGGTP